MDSFKTKLGIKKVFCTKSWFKIKFRPIWKDFVEGVVFFRYIKVHLKLPKNKASIWCSLWKEYQIYHKEQPEQHNLYRAIKFSHYITCTKKLK